MLVTTIFSLLALFSTLWEIISSCLQMLGIWTSTVLLSGKEFPWHTTKWVYVEGVNDDQTAHNVQCHSRDDLLTSLSLPLNFVCEYIFHSLCNLLVSLISPLPHNDDFWLTGGKILLKTLWKKKKMLVTSICFFSHNVFYPMKDNLNIMSNNPFVVCKCF